MDKYQDLKRELKRIWSSSEVTVIHIAIGALRKISTNFNHWLVKTSHNLNFGTLQKACLLGTAKSLRYALNIQGRGSILNTQFNI